MRFNWRAPLGLALCATYLSACAQDVEDIDRTKPNKVEKALFQNDDEWYYQQTVVQTDFQSGAGWDGLVFPGWESGLYRIRWTITEDTLFGYSSLEAVDGAHEGIDSPEDRRVGLVAAFPISSHFDVQRGYNSATGEQTNTISENTSDRDWYERKYMRVDWSRNLVAGGFGSIEGGFGSFSVSEHDVPQEDARIDPDRTRISDEYIDTVTEYNFEPDPIACWDIFGFDAAYTCQGGPVRMRHSFMKVPTEVTYEPFEALDQKPVLDEDGNRVMTKTIQYYDFDDPDAAPEVQGLQLEAECTPQVLQYDRTIFGSGETDDCTFATMDYYNKFGVFRTERLAYSQDRGSNIEGARRYYANRWNIWQTAYDADGNVLEMSARRPKPIVYYTNVAFPNHMWDETQIIANQWDDVFSDAASRAMGVSRTAVADMLTEDFGNDGSLYEIRRNSCSPEGISAYAGNGEFDDVVAEFKSTWGDFGSADSPNYEAWDAAPTRKQEAFCAELEYVTEGEETPFLFQRPGDLRFSMFTWHETQNNFWSGYGPSAADPKTGEIIAGDANYAGARHEYITNVVTDYIRFFNGDLPEDDLIAGEQIWEHAQQVRKNHQTQRQELTTEGREEVSRRLASGPRTFDSNDKNGPKGMPIEFQKYGLDNIKKDAFLMSRANHLAKASDTRVAEFFDRPRVKEMVLADPNFRVMVEARAASMFGPNFNDDQFHQAYLMSKAPNLESDRYQRLNAAFSERNIMLNEVMEDQMMSLVTYSGIADHFKGADIEDVKDYVRSKYFIAVQLHEIGHTIGMAHNFAGTYDAMNYQDEFWMIQQAVAEGKLTMDERYSLTRDQFKEITGSDLPADTAYFSQAEYRNASIMDYGGDITSDFDGLGKYDNAYVHFYYGNLIEKFDDSVTLADDWDFDLFVSDYTEIPRIIEGVNQLPEDEAAQRDLEISGIAKLLGSREWITLKEAEEQYLQGIRSNTSNLLSQLEDDNGANSEQIITTDSVWIDKLVPYRYCTNGREWVELGCATGDWGANQREVVNHKFDKYRIFQPLQRYNRGRLNKAWDNVNNYYGFVLGTLRSVEVPFRLYSYYQWFSFLEDLRDDLQEASIDSINFYAEIAGKPEPGRYCRYDAANSRWGAEWYYDDALEDAYLPSDSHNDVGGCPGFIDIPRGVGEFYNYDINDEYDYRVNRVGTYIDKELATSVLFQIAGNFVASSFITDFRATNISYWTLFQDELYGFLRGIILGDYAGYAGVYDPAKGAYEPAVLVDRKTFGLPYENEQRNMSRIFTPMSFNHEFNALAYGMLFNSTWQDRSVDFSQFVKVSVTADEAQEYPDDVVVAEFVHPTTNQIYTAPEGPEGKSIAVDLVNYANKLKNNYYTAEAELETARVNLDACSSNCTALETTFRDRSDDLEIRAEQLEEVVGKLNTIRYVFEVIGQDFR